MELWTAFTLGLFGSLHCLGMCGPIAMALPFQGISRLHTLWNALLYNMGRIITYAGLGIIPGLLGYSVYLAGFQQWLSITTGILIIVSLLFSINLEYGLWQFASMKRVGIFLQQQLGKRLKTGGQRTFLTIGLLNGLLPCGMVYIAFAGAFIQTRVLDSLLYMATFGLGTLPLMLLMSLSTQVIRPQWRWVLRKWIPLFVFIMGLLFIIRGLEVELPSDIRMWLSRGAAPFCH